MVGWGGGGSKSYAHVCLWVEWTTSSNSYYSLCILLSFFLIIASTRTNPASASVFWCQASTVGQALDLLADTIRRAEVPCVCAYSSYLSPEGQQTKTQWLHSRLNGVFLAPPLDPQDNVEDTQQRAEIPTRDNKGPPRPICINMSTIYRPANGIWFDKQG